MDNMWAKLISYFRQQFFTLPLVKLTVARPKKILFFFFSFCQNPLRLFATFRLTALWQTDRCSYLIGKHTTEWTQVFERPCCCFHFCLYSCRYLSMLPLSPPPSSLVDVLGELPPLPLPGLRPFLSSTWSPFPLPDIVIIIWHHYGLLSGIGIGWDPGGWSIEH